MIKKTYYLGRFKGASDFAGNYLIGIHRQGEGTVPFPKETINGVKNDITTRFINSIDILRGYLTAVVGEYQFEGFDVEFKLWQSETDQLFSAYMEKVPSFSGNVSPLIQHDLMNLESIVGLKIKSTS